MAKEYINKKSTTDNMSLKELNDKKINDSNEHIYMKLFFFIATSTSNQNNNL